MKNISGIFEITLDGETYEAKCNFGVVERLERRIFEKSIFEILSDAGNGKIYMSMVVDVIHTAITAGGTKNLNREKIGDIIVSEGLEKFVEWYISFLTYALTGEVHPDFKEETEEDKKK